MNRAVAHVHETMVPPDPVLADIDALDPGGRMEGEIVVNPALLGEVRRL